jgi:hypothetical protein
VRKEQREESRDEVREERRESVQTCVNSVSGQDVRRRVRSEHRVGGEREGGGSGRGLWLFNILT